MIKPCKHLSCSQIADGLNYHPFRKIYEPDMSIPEPQQVEGSGQIYFEALHIQPLKLNISFTRTDELDIDSNTRATTATTASSHNPLRLLANILTMAIGSINVSLTDITNALSFHSD
jgi:hypothetical protein